MTHIYRETDPVSGRWTGNNGGADLSAFQIDQNFYQIIQDVATLQADMIFTVGIDYITISGNELTFHMTDHTLQGPFEIPVATFRDRGVWAPSTSYSVNDTFNDNGVLYLVIFAHVSALTFDAGANDGLGHNYYSAMLSTPGNVLPTGGAVGMMLYKTSGADFAVSWRYPVPVGGLTGQFLTKASNSDFDASWGIGYSVPAGGDSGQKLVKHSASDGDTLWKSDTLALLTDVGIGSPLADGDALVYNGTIWTNRKSVGRQTIFVPAAGMLPNTTNGSAAATAESSTNKVMTSTQNFDPSTQQFAQISVAMPKSWDGGSVFFTPYWSHPATTTNFGVVFGVDAVAIDDAGAFDAAFGTAQTSADVGGATDHLYAGPESAAITIGGTPAGGKLVVFRVHRNPADGSDTLAVAARLHGIQITYSTDAMTDD